MPAQLVVGEVVQKESVPRERLKSAGLPVPDEGPEFMTRELIKVGNRDLNGTDFTWIVGDWLTNQTTRSEEHTSELQSLMRSSYAVFCLKKKNDDTTHNYNPLTTTTITTQYKPSR